MIDKVKINYIYNMTVGTILIILISLNRFYIKSDTLTCVLFGFCIAQLIKVILEFIITSIESKRLREKLDEIYKDDELYQKLFKKH
jgi:hypothetical protein